MRFIKMRCPLEQAPIVSGHFLRAVTDTNTQAPILSVDGIGAYDHVLRATLLGRLARMPN